MRLALSWPQRNALAASLVAGAAILALTAACYRLRLPFMAVSPLYLLAIVWQSLSGSFAGSALISVLAVGCLDYFFVDPLFSFWVAGRLSLIALLSFLITSLVITKLVTRVRREASVSTSHKDRIDRLYHLAQHLLALEPESAVGEHLLEPFLGVFGIRAVSIFDGGPAELHTLGDSRANLGERTRNAFLQHLDVDDPLTAVSLRSLRVAGKTIGSMGFEGLEEPELTAGPLISLAAASRERTRAFQKASEVSAAAQTEVYRSAILDALAQEFKTPLSTILAAAGGIRETGFLRPEQTEMAETVEAEATRLATLTSRLLKVARLDREDVRPQTEFVDIGALVESMVDQYKRLPTDRPIILDRPPAPLEARADPELLRLALSQLLDNACRYSAPGSTIRVTVRAEGHTIIARVTNSGSIPENERLRIFDRFFRGTEARRYTAGSGLGLYVARKIALAHGGSLDLDLDRLDQEEVTFSLAIPAEEADSA